MIGEFIPPNYSLIRYEFEDNEELIDPLNVARFFKKLGLRYTEQKENLFLWFKNLTDDQLNDIGLSNDEYGTEHHDSVRTKCVDDSTLRYTIIWKRHVDGMNYYGMTVEDFRQIHTLMASRERQRRFDNLSIQL